SLRQSVGDVLRVLGQIPLQMAGHPGAVVENAEQHGRAPFPARSQHFTRAHVAIPMDQGSHMFGLVAADLPLGQLGLGRRADWFAARAARLSQCNWALQFGCAAYWACNACRNAALTEVCRPASWRGL